MEFLSANTAFEYYYELINNNGHSFGDTKCLFNKGFYILNPLDNKISAEWRKWKQDYAEFEWQWYLSGDPSGEEISKRASIWKNHMDEKGLVRSNYGWQWRRFNQIDKVVNKLRFNKNTRQAVISIYDGKEIDSYKYDTPCTLSIHFQIIEEKLCMTVNMRSNDLWYGFCNDQYCFSKLQELIAKKLDLNIGWYYHFSSNLHLYIKDLNKTFINNE